jgi:hypothetical protein
MLRFTLQYGRCREKEDFVPLSETEPNFLGCLVSIFVDIPSGLCTDAMLCLPLASRWFLDWFILRREDVGDILLQNDGRFLDGLHGVISQKIELFITTAVINSDHKISISFPTHRTIFEKVNGKRSANARYMDSRLSTDGRTTVLDYTGLQALSGYSTHLN